MKKAILLYMTCVLTTFAVTAQTRVAYSPEGKIHFKTSSAKILINFKKKVSPVQKSNKISNNRFSSLIRKENNIRKDGPIALALMEDVSEDTLKNIIQSFRDDSSTVEYANPFLVYDDGTLQGISNQIIVQLKEGVSTEEFKKLLSSFNIDSFQKNEFIEREYLLTIDKPKEGDALDIANKLYEAGIFKYAEVNFIRILKMHSSDPYYGYQWAMENTGSSIQYSGTSDADMDIKEAWCYTTGN